MHYLWVAVGIAVLLGVVYLTVFGGKEQCRNCGCYLPRRATVCPRCGRAVGEEEYFPHTRK